MCTIVLTDDGEEITTVADLRKLWPVLILNRGGVLEPSDDEEYCLCPIDVPGSALVNGWRANHDSTWGEYTVKRKSDALSVKSSNVAGSHGGKE